MPTLYVNGEKYDFSEEVILRGNSLYRSFVELFKCFQRSFMKKHYTLSETDFELINLNVMSCLEEFDQLWTHYEDLYVHELMVIEMHSRRFITEAITAESQLTEIEKTRRQTGNFVDEKGNKSEWTQANQTFTKILAKINSVANFEGHGRDDLTVDILYAANDVLLKITACESQNLRKLAQRIIDSYEQLRELLRRYNENIEIVDPQLRNNPDLVDALLEYEKNWEKGKIYLLNTKRCDQLIFFTNVIEGLCEKYATFKENMECCEAEIFVQIPMIMLLKKVEKEDSDICEVFLPQIMETESSCYKMFNNVKSDLLRINDRFVVLRDKNNHKGKSNIGVGLLGFTNGEKNGLGYKTLLKSGKSGPESGKVPIKKLNYEFYNFLEKKVLGENLGGKNEGLLFGKEDEDILEKGILNLRHLSIDLQRFNPMEWNAFLDIAMSR